jgi:uncharacterized membrane protein
MLARTLLCLAFLWPIVLASGWWYRADNTVRGTWDLVVYAAAAQVCHQRPDRSFHTADTPWPVCGRCSGLYLAAPVGASLGWWRRHRLRASARAWLAATALPTALTLGLEWWGLSVSNGARALAALPLGAAIAATLVRTAAGQARAIK